MRRRPCPRPAWRTGIFRPASLALLGFALAVPMVAHAQADKGIIGDRVDRVQGAQAQQAAQQKADAEPWSPAKIIINLDARCPVVTALGYFGAFANADKDPAKSAELQARYAQLQKTIQPMADELKKLAVETTFVGPKFPETILPRLQVMSGDLFAAVAKLYGEAGLGELKQYMATQSQGVVVK